MYLSFPFILYILITFSKAISPCGTMTSVFRIYFSAAVCQTLTGTQWISFSTMAEIIGWLVAPGKGAVFHLEEMLIQHPLRETNRKKNVHLCVPPRHGETAILMYFRVVVFVVLFRLTAELIDTETQRHRHG